MDFTKILKNLNIAKRFSFEKLYYTLNFTRFGKVKFKNQMAILNCYCYVFLCVGSVGRAEPVSEFAEGLPVAPARVSPVGQYN